MSSSDTPGSDTWLASLPTSKDTASLFSKVMAQQGVMKEMAVVAKEARRAIQRPEGLTTFMKVGKPGVPGTIKCFAKEIGVSNFGSEVVVK